MVYIYLCGYLTQGSHCLTVGAFYICLQIFILIIKIRRYPNGKKVHFTLAKRMNNEAIKTFLCIISRALGG